MSGTIPFLPSDNNYRTSLPIDGSQYLIMVRWNSRDDAWYLDMYEYDETPVALGIKVVLGVSLGRTSPHQFFRDHIMHAVDTSGSGLDAKYDDLGTRVFVQITSLAELGLP